MGKNFETLPKSVKIGMHSNCSTLGTPPLGFGGITPDSWKDFWNASHKHGQELEEIDMTRNPQKRGIFQRRYQKCLIWCC